jgi:hypothetical protein
LLALWGVFAGGGRANLLGFLGASCVFAYMVRRRRLLLLTSLLLAGILVLILPVVGVESLIPEEYSRIVEFGDTSIITSALESGAGASRFKDPVMSEAAGSSLFRLMLWAVAIESIVQNPLLGAGVSPPESFYLVSRNEALPDQMILQSGNLHNTMLSLAYVWGIPAMVVFFVLWIGGLKKSYYLFTTRGYPLYVFLLLYFSAQLLESFAGDIHLIYPNLMLLGLMYRHSSTKEFQRSSRSVETREGA